ncbi:MAG: inosine/xanthosine triphosphatase [Chloroflexi bacterium]|nr:inosine/xanthosine triphosphatase [Chloroflexota bacterium]
MRIATGSTNPVKCNAVRAVLGPLHPGAEFVAIEVPSGVSSQPWGNAETRRGAFNRARAALDATGADLAVGLEGGVQETEFGLMTCAWCALVDRAGRVGIGGNSCILLPPLVADHVRSGGELGQAMDTLTHSLNTKHQNGAIGILTHDLETRQSAYETNLRLALASFQNPAWYPVSE